MSQQNTATEDRILDAAYAQVMAVGFRRTTLTDVAERAGLSRMTVYRRFPDVTSVLQELMTREFSWIVERAAEEAADAPDERPRLVGSAVRGAELISEHELYLRLLDVDPELLLPYFTQRAGRFQVAVAEAYVPRLEAAMQSGAVRRDDPRRLTRSMLLAVRGFVLSAREEWTRKERRAALADLGRMLDGLLAP